MPMEKINGFFVALLLLTGLSDVASAHVDPFINTSGNTYRVDYTSGNLYTIDTIGDGFSTPNADCYIAMGGGELFYQDISGGYVISQSCMPITQRKTYLKISPVIVPFVDAVNRYTNTKNTVLWIEDARLKEGLRSCMIY